MTMALTQVSDNGLTNTGVTAATYGSSSAIPSLTIDAKGRVTSATTNSITQVGGSNGVDFNDSVKARFGTGNDLEIQHNAIDSYITHLGTGDLYIQNTTNDKDIVLQSDNGSGGVSKYIQCDGSDGKVRLYYYGTQKLATKSDGVNITGELECDSLDVDGNSSLSGDVDFIGDNYNAVWDKSANRLKFNDNAKAAFGTNPDMTIYHDGTNSNIVNNTGDLYIQGQGDDIIMRAADDIFIQVQNGEDGIKVHGNGSVELYHDNSNKLQTKSDGVNITGELECDSLDVNGNVNINNGHNTDVQIVGTGDVVLTLNADTDNSNESNHPELRFTQDGSQNILNIGVTGSSGENFTGSTGNNPYIHVTNAHGAILDLEIATNNTKRLILTESGHLLPAANDAYDLGSSSLRWRNVYTNDLNLSNEGSTNDVDGTWGNFTIQEGEDDLFLINRRNGKKYKFNLTEVN